MAWPQNGQYDTVVSRSDTVVVFSSCSGRIHSIMRVRFVIASVMLRANRSDVDLLQPILSIAVTSYWTPHYNQSAPIQSATNWLWIDCRPCCTQSSLPCWDVRLLSFSWLSSLTQPSANCLCCLHVADIINLSLLSVCPSVSNCFNQEYDRTKRNMKCL